MTRDGRYVVRWRPVPEPIPWNESFELEVSVSDGKDGEPIDAARVHVHALMPDHGHGMNRRTRSRRLGEGRYRVEGMLFHMRGSWVLSISVVGTRGGDVATFEVEL